jgi:hypothetical protein
MFGTEAKNRERVVVALRLRTQRWWMFFQNTNVSRGVHWGSYFWGSCSVVDSYLSKWYIKDREKTIRDLPFPDDVVHGAAHSRV